MLEPPLDAGEDEIAAQLETAYGVVAEEIAFLPAGADAAAAAFRVRARDGETYFLKLRRGRLYEAAVTVPEWLAERGYPHVVAPVRSRAGAPWVPIPPYVAILYPFVEGRSGWDATMSGDQWTRFGEALRALHTVRLPPALAGAVSRETYAGRWRRRVRAYLRRARGSAFRDPVSRDLAELLLSRAQTIGTLVERAERLAGVVAAGNRELSLCHGDLHAGNVLIDADGRLYIVDWDTLVFAPKERDLMFVGGGVGGTWNRTDEIDRFYQGYGQVAIDRAALAYYRCERIIRDVAAYVEQIWDGGARGEDRREGLAQLASQFGPGNVVEIALATDPGPH